MTVRTKQLEPNYRHEPKTNHFCCKCQKDIKGKFRMVHIIAAGAQVLHPDDEEKYVPDSGDMGGFPIGPDCARKLGLEWSTPA